MRNRFQKKKRRFAWVKTALPVLLFAAVFACFFKGVGSVSEGAGAQKLQSIQAAVQKNIVQCYALEGRYPQSLEYLEEHYGLYYDKERYVVAYEVLGSNLMPDVTVIEKR